MGEFCDRLDEKLRRFIDEQKMFFTASAPVRGRINLSPKGMNTLRVLDQTRVAYLDLTGSGNETAAHVEENGRLTLMWCSFGPSAMILRLYGRARVVHRGAAEWERLFALFEPIVGTRQIIVLDIDSVQTSCGYGVPRYEFVEERAALRLWAERKGPQGISDYWRTHNRTSIDGLPTYLVDDRD